LCHLNTGADEGILMRKQPHSATNIRDTSCTTICAGISIGGANQAYILSKDGKPLGNQSFNHGGEGLAQMADWLAKVADSEPEHIHVTIETPRNPVVKTLLEHGFHVYSINPKQLDRFQFSPAGD